MGGGLGEGEERKLACDGDRVSAWEGKKVTVVTAAQRCECT